MEGKEEVLSEGESPDVTPGGGADDMQQFMAQVGKLGCPLIVQRRLQ